MIQQIIVLTLFLGAVAYLGRIVYKSFQAKSNCATGCGKCGAINVDEIERKFREKQNLA